MKEFEYLRTYSIKKYVPFTGAVFGVLIFAFAVLSLMQSQVSYPELTNSLIDASSIGCSSSNPIGSTCGYFLHNSSISLIAWLGGFAIIGPFYILWENGMNIGSYIGTAITDPDSLHGWDTTVEALAFLIPHGIIEIPAIIISCSLGIYIAETILNHRTNMEDYDVLATFKETAPYAILVIGMLGIAAFIEANISVQFAKFVGGMF